MSHAPPPPQAPAASPDHVAAYLGSVREHLTVRGVSRERVGAHLEEMAAHLADSGRAPDQEYGPADDYAAALAEAENVPAWQVWVRPIGGLISVVSLMLALVYLGEGTGPGLAEGDRIANAVPYGFLGLTASVFGARSRDRVRGFATGSDGPNPFVVLAVMSALVIALSILLFVTIGDRQVGIEGVPGWILGIGFVVLFLATGWHSIIKPSLAPKFPEGSTLRTSMFSRKVRSG